MYIRINLDSNFVDCVRNFTSDIALFKNKLETSYLRCQQGAMHEANSEQTIDSQYLCVFRWDMLYKMEWWDILMICTSAKTEMSTGLHVDETLSKMVIIASPGNRVRIDIVVSVTKRFLSLVVVFYP